MRFKQCVPYAAALCGMAAQVLAQETGDTAPTRAVLEEIVVSAQRRSENLQDVPISVSTVSGETAERMGIDDSMDIPIMAPAVTFTSSVGGGNTTIRGVGGTGSASDDPANAVYIDGVYQAAPGSLIFSLNNIERIEVLKGPQGTLFGRNATGGVVQIITREPSHEWRFNGSTTVSNYETFAGNLYVTGGLSDTLAADVALFAREQNEGWGTNVLTGADAYTGNSRAARSKWAWKPRDEMSFTLIGTYTESEPAEGGGSQIVPGFLTAARTGHPGDFYDLNQDGVTRIGFDQRAVSLTSEFDLSWARLLNITSFDRTQNEQRFDPDASPLPFGQTHTVITNEAIASELQLQSRGDADVSWVLGAYFLDMTQDVDSILVGWAGPGGGRTGPPLGFQGVIAKAGSNSYALFGQTTFPIATRTDLTLGVRYSLDQRELVQDVALGTGPFTRTTRPQVEEERPTWRVALDHDFLDHVSAYASVSRGYKSGLYNVFGGPTAPPVESQIVDAYELGLKTELAAGTLRLNGALFYNDFQDIQVRTINASGSTLTLNAAAARIQGVDIDFMALLSERLSLQGGVVYIDGEYTNFPRSPGFALPPPPAGGLVPTTVDATGRATQFTPEWVGTLAAHYTVPTDTGEFELAAGWHYNSGFFWEPSNFVPQPSYSLVNASLKWTAPSTHWSIRLWGNNLLSQEYYSNVLITGSNGAGYFPAPPRTFGMTFSFEY